MTRRSASAITIRRLAPASGVTRGELVRAVRLAAGSKPIQSVSIVLASDSLIADLHGRFMGDPSPTDVLTFDLRDEPDLEGAPIDGEVVLSVETARREARRRRLPERQEVLRYAIHGTLHLVGYDDATPGQRRKMRLQENRVLARLAAGD